MAEYSEAPCQICGKKYPNKKLARASMVRPTVVASIEKKFPGWSAEGFICAEDFNRFHSQYIYSMVEAEKGEMSELEKEVVESITRHEILAMAVDQGYDAQFTFAQRLSDRMARFGGSWDFLLLFTAIVAAARIAVYSISLLSRSFDPYPYILLNLVLSRLTRGALPVW